MGADRWRKPGRPGRLVLLALAALVLPAAGCGGVSTPRLERNAGVFFSSLHQATDPEAPPERADDAWWRLASVDASAPASREGKEWEDWKSGVLAAVRRYERERDEGKMTLDPRGYTIVRATMVGRGTYWETVGREGGADDPVLRVRLSFGYGEIWYGSLPPLTHVYLLGWPLGTVHHIRIGLGKTYRMDVLDHLDLLVHFRRVKPRRPDEATWKVDRVTWDPASAVHRQVEWTF